MLQSEVKFVLESRTEVDEGLCPTHSNPHDFCHLSDSLPLALRSPSFEWLTCLDYSTHTSLGDFSLSPLSSIPWETVAKMRLLSEAVLVHAYLIHYWKMPIPSLCQNRPSK